MNTTSCNYIAHCSMSSLRDFKLAALYFDKINITKPFLMKAVVPHEDGIEIVGIEFADDEFVNQLLSTDCFSYETYGLQITTEDSEGGGVTVTAYDPGADETVRSIVAEHLSLIFPSSIRQGDVVIVDEKNLSVSPEAEAIYREVLRNVKIQSQANASIVWSEDENENRINFLLDYYSTQLGRLLQASGEQSFALTNSRILSDIVHLHQASKIQKSTSTTRRSNGLAPTIALDSLQVFLPDLSMASFEDILEFKYAARDELDAFRSYLLDIELSVASEDNPFIFAKRVLDARVLPAVNDLTTKLRGLKIKSAASVLDQVKDPRSYVPLLGTVVADIPAYLGIAASLAMVGAKTALDYIADSAPLRSSGVYFLLQCQKSFSGLGSNPSSSASPTTPADFKR